MTEIHPAKVPRNPYIGFVYTVVWIIITVALSSVLLSYTGSQESVFDTEGTRTAGFILTMPFIALAASVFCFIRAFNAVAPYKKYVNSTTPQQRQENEIAQWSHIETAGSRMATLILFTAACIIGWLVLALVLLINYQRISETANSRATFLGVFLLIGLCAGSLLRLTSRIRRASKK
jgi:MFS family permease